MPSALASACMYSMLAESKAPPDLLSDPLSRLVMTMAGPPETIVMGLERMRAAMALLSMSDQLPMPLIMVGGTNGKGSTVACLETLYRQAGYRVAAYTSPHLWQFTERLRLDAVPAAVAVWTETLEYLATITRQIALTFFEITTLAALRMILQSKMDVAILEVGLGGRLDAVNAFSPDCSIVTTVDLDHQDWLGPDRLSIGREKAGIFRSGVPALYGDAQDPCLSVVEEAERRTVPLHLLGRDFDYDSAERIWRGYGQTLRMPTPLWPAPAQWQNLALAFAAIHHLQDRLPVPEVVINHWQLRPSLPGRSQILRPWGSTGPHLLVDVAHNPQAVKQLAEVLAQYSGRCHAFVGMLSDKDIPGTLSVLLQRVAVWHVLDMPDTPRAAAVEYLEQCLRTLGADQVKIVEHMEEAMDQARIGLRAEDIIVCFGSFHLVKQLPPHWLNETVAH